jgi:hypothetical protein
MKVMKRRRKKEFPSLPVNRFRYPLTDKRSLIGISGMTGIDPALQMAQASPLLDEPPRSESIPDETTSDGSQVKTENP